MKNGRRSLSDSNGFWDEVAASSPRSARVVEAFKKYADTMDEGGLPLPLRQGAMEPRPKGARF